MALAIETRPAADFTVVVSPYVAITEKVEAAGEEKDSGSTSDESKSGDTSSTVTESKVTESSNKH